MSRFRYIDVFCGVGGFSEGARQVGGSCVWAVDNDFDACLWKRWNHGGIVIRGNVERVDWEKVPPYEILLASPPCQGHSRARGGDDRNGRGDEYDFEGKRGLGWEVVRCVGSTRPVGFVVENVPDMVRWGQYGMWRSSLEELGYELTELVIDAADCGVPQNRVRLFVVGVWVGLHRGPLEWENPRMRHVGIEEVIDLEEKRGLISISTCSEVTRWKFERTRLKYGDVFMHSFHKGNKLGRKVSRPLGTILAVRTWWLVKGDMTRSLTLPELIKVMGFPDYYLFPQKIKRAERLIGNAVCPPVSRSIVGQLADHLGL